MQTVQQLLDQKGYQVWSVSPEQSVYEATSQLSERNVGALPVLDDGRLVGIFSERDCVRRVVLARRSLTDTRVSDVMTTSVKIARMTDSVDRCMRIMTELRIRHLPIVDDERVLGMISVGDLVKAQLSERESLIHDLESYIGGSGAGIGHSLV
jgi:CBS domain-containing protein